MNVPIFAPVIALVAWTMIMALWMVVGRVGAMKSVDPAALAKPGLRGVDLDPVLPNSAKWPGHNYNHLMEQPTVFYAVALVLALAGGGGDMVNVNLAWAYVILRVAHSLVQSTFNAVNVRFPVWALASIALIALTVRAGLLVF